MVSHCCRARRGGGGDAAVAQKTVSAELQDAEKLLSSGDVAGAAAALQKIVAGSPAVFEARLLLGRALDLEGRHADARVHLEQALRLASDDEQRTDALLALGVSYAFESKADEAARYYQRVFDADIQADERGAAAGRANGLGRIYLESGNVQKAEGGKTVRDGEEDSRTPGATGDAVGRCAGTTRWDESPPERPA